MFIEDMFFVGPHLILCYGIWILEGFEQYMEMTLIAGFLANDLGHP